MASTTKSARKRGVTPDPSQATLLKVFRQTTTELGIDVRARDPELEPMRAPEGLVDWSEPHVREAYCRILDL